MAAGGKSQMRGKGRTKIVATLGPSSSSREMIAALFAAGADVFRINMSHTTHERMREFMRMIRDIETANARPIGVLVDLQGPKLRVGAFREDAVLLVKGADFVLDADPAPGDATRVHLPHPEILSALKPGHTLLLDDGKIRLVALEVTPQRARTRVEVGGKLSARKGVSVPDTVLGFSALTGKDHSDLEAALDAGADWIALSFIQRPEDIAEAKKIARGRAAVMAKIEKPQAIRPTAPSSTPRARPRRRPAPMPSPRRRARSPRRSISTRSCAGPPPARPRCGWRASARRRPSCRSRRTSPPAASWRWYGA